jgi:hypothetical protein
MVPTHRLRSIALLSVALCELACSQSRAKAQVRHDTAGPFCAFTVPGIAGAQLVPVGGHSDVVSVALAADGHGESVVIKGIVACRKTQKGLEADVTTMTLGGKPVAIYETQRPSKENGNASRVALRAGESVSDTITAFTADKKLVAVPTRVTCRNHAGKLGLGMDATLDGQPVEFYVQADADGTRFFVLKHGQEVPGSTKATVKSWTP